MTKVCIQAYSHTSAMFDMDVRNYRVESRNYSMYSFALVNIMCDKQVYVQVLMGNV